MSDVLQLMGLALRARGLVAGEEVVADAVSTHRARLLLVAEDAAEGTVRKARNLSAGRLPVLTGTCRQGGHRRRAGQRQLRGGCGAGRRLCRPDRRAAGGAEPGVPGDRGGAGPETGKALAPQKRETAETMKYNRNSSGRGGRLRR